MLVPLIRLVVLVVMSGQVIRPVQAADDRDLIRARAANGTIQSRHVGLPRGPVAGGGTGAAEGGFVVQFEHHLVVALEGPRHRVQNLVELVAVLAMIAAGAGTIGLVYPMQIQDHVHAGRLGPPHRTRDVLGIDGGGARGRACPYSSPGSGQYGRGSPSSRS